MRQWHFITLLARPTSRQRDGHVRHRDRLLLITALSAMALSLLFSVASAAGTSVRVASLLVALPKAFVTRQRNFAPLSEAVVAAVV